jgi:hypothetical protein
MAKVISGQQEQAPLKRGWPLGDALITNSGLFMFIVSQPLAAKLKKALTIADVG